jgi:hypothetical protein
MPFALRNRRKTKDVTHSIPDLLSESTHGFGSFLFGFAFPDLAPNAAAQPLFAVRHDKGNVSGIPGDPVRGSR